jgi:hypothetical protein
MTSACPTASWEAKDTDDDLDREIRRKLDKGYPTKNTIFQEPNRAVLMQDGGITFDADIRDPERLVEVLRLFFAYEEPAHEEWTQAVANFKDRVPQMARRFRKPSRRSATSLFELCRKLLESVAFLPLCWGDDAPRPHRNEQFSGTASRETRPDADPIYGTEGPLLRHWHGNAT